MSVTQCHKLSIQSTFPYNPAPASSPLQPGPSPLLLHPMLSILAPAILSKHWCYNGWQNCVGSHQILLLEVCAEICSTYAMCMVECTHCAPDLRKGSLYKPYCPLHRVTASSSIPNKIPKNKKSIPIPNQLIYELFNSKSIPNTQPSIPIPIPIPELELNWNSK